MIVPVVMIAAAAPGAIETVVSPYTAMPQLRSPEKDLMRALEHYGVHHKDIVYAQAVLETGHFTSKPCVVYNNLFGLYDGKNKRYYRFSHWTESVIMYRDRIQSRYRNGENYYSFLRRIKYARDNNYITKIKNIITRNNNGQK